MNKFESNYTDPLSYSTIKNLIGQFRRSNGTEGSDFNKFETPGHYYFKILFYFNNPSQDDFTSNLLSCDWIISQFDANNYKFSNSAYNYLMLNDEKERAENLKKFIYLLSDINSQSPWYWQSISGLDTALERKIITENDFKLEDRKSIVIKCLPDAYDDRIGTLLDLYRSICYSYTNKKEIVPANLRKFDMGIYIFNTLMYNDENYGNTDDPTYPYFSTNTFRNNHFYRASSKYIELHNCEIDYNSSKTGYGDLNNADGKSNEFSITIFFDDAYENRYNEFVTSDIGDFIKVDLIEQSKQCKYDYDTDYDNNRDIIETQKGLFQSRYGNTYIPQDSNKAHLRKVNDLTNPDGNKSLFSNTVDQVVGHVSEKLKTLGKSIYLGNLYGLSLSKVKDQVKDVMSGNIFNTVNAIQDYVEHTNREKGEMESLENRTLWERPENTQLNNSSNIKVPKNDNLFYGDSITASQMRGKNNQIKVDDSMLLMDTSFEDGRMIVTHKKLWEQPLQMNNKPSGNLWDVDIENDIIKRGQQSSLLNTKRSLK